jgi:manganese transport protein
MAAGSIFSGIYGEPYDIKDNHSRLGIAISFIAALAIIFVISNPFQGLIISQMVLSIQLPVTIFVQVKLTSSQKVMGKFKNSKWDTYFLYLIGAIVTLLNIALLISFLI